MRMASVLGPFQCSSLLHPSELWAGPAPPTATSCPWGCSSPTIPQDSLYTAGTAAVRQSGPSQGSPTTPRSYSPSRQSFVSTSNRWLKVKELGLEASSTTRTDKFQQVQKFNWSLTCLSLLLFHKPRPYKCVSSVIPQNIIKYARG